MSTLWGPLWHYGTKIHSLQTLSSLDTLQDTNTGRLVIDETRLANYFMSECPAVENYFVS